MDEVFLSVFGHTAYDIILQVAEKPKLNSSTKVLSRVKRRGGTAANIAMMSSEMDVNVRLVSFVGEDFDEGYMKSLKKAGVDTSDLQRVKGKDTPTCWIVSLPGGEQMAFIDQGAMENIDDYEVPTDSITLPEIIHIGTGKPSYYSRVMDLGAKKGKKIAFDPGQELRYVYDPSKFKKMLSMSDIFFCNSSEYSLALEYIGGSKLEDLHSYVGIIVITKGKDGSTLITDEGVVHIPSYVPKKIVEPTGAGDAYRAGFYAGFSRGLSLERCCELGSARASFTLEQAGPQESHVDWEKLTIRLKPPTTD